MNARKLSNFLQSMERSCDLYSGSALQERQKLMEVDTQYKELDKTVHRTLNVVPRKTAPPTRPQTQKSRARTASRMRAADSDSQQLVVRPAPYPVKNYILPATQLVGPKRYYRSRAQQQIRSDEISAEAEFERFPYAFEHPPNQEQPNLVITPTRTLRSRPPSAQSFDF